MTMMELANVVGALTRKVLFLENENSKLRTKENKSDNGVGKGHKDKEKEFTIEEEVMEKRF